MNSITNKKFYKNIYLRNSIQGIYHNIVYLASLIKCKLYVGECILVNFKNETKVVLNSIKNYFCILSLLYYFLQDDMF